MTYFARAFGQKEFCRNEGLEGACPRWAFSKGFEPDFGDYQKKVHFFSKLNTSSGEKGKKSKFGLRLQPI